MDELNKKAVATIEIDATDALKRLAEIEKAKKSLKKANEELAKSEEDQTEAIIANTLETSKLTKESQALKRQLEQQEKAAKSSTGSIEQLRAKYALLKKQYDGLSKAQRITTKEGQDLAKSLNDLSNEINEANKEAGSFKENIGRYPELLASVGEAAGAAGEGIAEIAPQTKSVKSALDTLKANPIIAIVAAVVALIGAFKQNQKFAELFNRVFDTIGNTLTVVISKLAAFGGTIAELFTDLTDGVISINDLLTGFFDRVTKGFGVLFDGIKKLDFKQIIDGLVQSTTGMEKFTDRASKAADEIGRQVSALNDLDAAQRKLERSQILNISRSKELIAQEEALKNVRDNEFNTIEKRIDANEKASKIEEARLANELKFAREALRIQEAKIKIIGEENSSNDQLREREEARLQVQDLIEESIGRQNELLTNRFQLIQERLQLEAELEQRLSADRIAFLNIELKKVEETSKEAADIRAKLATETAKQALIDLELEEKQQIELAKRRGESVAEVEQQFANRKVEIVASSEKEIDQIYADFYQNEADRRKESISEFEKLQQDRIKVLQESYTELTSAQDTALKKANNEALAGVNDLGRGLAKAQEQIRKNEAANLANRIAANKGAQQRVKDDTLLFETQKQSELKKLQEEQINLEKQASDKKIENLQIEQEQRQQIAEAQLQVANSIVDGLAAGFELLAESEEQATELAKVAALAKIAIDTASAISSLVANSSANPANAVTFGAAGAAQFATGLAQILGNILKAKQLLSLELGGDVSDALEKQNGIQIGGKRHSQGGTKYVGEDGNAFEVEQGEKMYVLKRNDSARIRKLSAMNVARGGVPFYELGGSVNIPSQAGSDVAEITNTLLRAITRPTIVRVTDINRVSGNASQAKASATLK